MTPQEIIKARLRELAISPDQRVTVRQRKDATYVNLGGADYHAAIRLLHKLFPEAYLTSGGAFDQTFRLGPQATIDAVVAGIAIDPAWLLWNDRTVLRLAQGISKSGEFERLPILADALEEAGCANALLVDHCRAGAKHAHSCWVVDLLISAGKKLPKK